MNFNVLGFMVSREMAKHELGSGKEDRANQLGLVGAVVPDPMMGAVLAMIVAKNEGASPPTTTPSNATSSRPTQTPLIRLEVNGQVHPIGEPLRFPTQYKGSSPDPVSYPGTLILV